MALSDGRRMLADAQNWKNLITQFRTDINKDRVAYEEARSKQMDLVAKNMFMGKLAKEFPTEWAA